jgi:TatD DNase family protein
MKLIDTFCHLFMNPLAEDLMGVLTRAVENGVTRIVVPTYDLKSWGQIRELAKLDGVLTALGLHPRVAYQEIMGNPTSTRDTAPVFREDDTQSNASSHELQEASLGSLTLTELQDQIASELREYHCVALGEIGLDFTIPRPTPKEQVNILRAQLELAVDLDLPVILHCQNGWELLVATIQPLVGRIRGVMHAYTRHPELAQTFLKCGFFVGFDGSIMQPQAKRALRSAEDLPLDRILLETFAPLNGVGELSPRQTEPCHVRDVAKALADIRNTTVDEIADITTNNAREFFRI